MEQKICNKDRELLACITTALRRFSEKLSTTGYTHRGSVDYIRAVKHFCYWQIHHNHSWEVDEPTIEKFLEHLTSCACPVSKGGSYRLCHAALGRFLIILREMGISPPAFKPVFPEDEVLYAFQTHLTQVHGAVESTALLYVRHLRPFLQGICKEGKFDFHKITVRDIEESVECNAKRYKPNTVKIYCKSLRAFFRFLRFRGEIELPLQDAVPTVPHWNLSSIPRYLPEDKIKTFLSSFDVNTTAGLRDRAMAQLMATVGLRAGEIANLKLEDIDWAKSSIRVCSAKSRRIDYLPLVSSAGEAMVAYLKRRKQVETRHIFINLSAPIGRPISTYVVSSAMKRAFKRCYPDEPAHGTHILRHSLATGMLKKGATFKEIADVLRHRSIGTTTIYAKVDLESLTNATLPWPEVMI